MLLLTQGHLALQVLDLSLELLNLAEQLVLVVFLLRSVCLDLLSDLADLFLELLTGCLAIPNELLVLSHVLLQVVENLKLLVQCDQSVKFVFELDLAFFES